jgi:hypothetical protein
MAETAASKDVKTNYPCVDGITAGTTTQQGHITNLEYENSIVLQRYKVLL